MQCASKGVWKDLNERMGKIASKSVADEQRDFGKGGNI